ncbi:MAG: bifunctional DNA-formamidopyrimidine glycosylase/DNA-(apurinic or apyrimidinic site) lyase [Terriglobales bacterium]
MPELPEVETIVRGLARRVVGDTITSVWIGSRPQPLKSPAPEIVRTLEGARIVGIRRAGKHILFELEGSGNTGATGQDAIAKKRAATKKKDAEAEAKEAEEKEWRKNSAHSASRAKKRVPEGRTKSATAELDPAAQWVVHLGMTGRLVVCEPGAEIAKHTHLIATLASRRELRFIDPRMFGKLSVHAAAFDPGGVEPLEVSEEDFVALFRGRKTPIKSALLNQKLVRGVGNIYADESLFRAGIRPRRRASTITRAQLGKLHHAVREVLREAIALGGSSISDYVDADGEEGFFQLQHRVYGREGEACLVCKTPVRRIVLVGRSSHYCPKCQK